MFMTYSMISSLVAIAPETIFWRMAAWSSSRRCSRETSGSMNDESAADLLPPDVVSPPPSPNWTRAQSIEFRLCTSCPIARNLPREIRGREKEREGEKREKEGERGIEREWVRESVRERVGERDREQAAEALAFFP